jgi:four helix bundle protein
MAGRNYSDLIAWQKAMDLVEEAYALSAQLPKEETYGLRAQVRRAAISVPANIAEGQGRRSPREFRRFLSIAHGSLRELETYTLLCERLRLAEPATRARLLSMSGEVGRLITSLRSAIVPNTIG